MGIWGRNRGKEIFDEDLRGREKMLWRVALSPSHLAGTFSTELLRAVVLLLLRGEPITSVLLRRVPAVGSWESPPSRQLGQHRGWNLACLGQLKQKT